MNLQMLLQESASFRRTVVLVVLLAILLLDWQPDPRLLVMPAQQRRDDRPLPEPGEVAPSRPLRPAHLDGRERPLPGPRQAARRRPGRRG
ncbi:MAG TPA: hypothetical protein VLQ93_07165 [Myxococcaceae bacterium]|nr:hypothetical protein [Myxococcaceae bacterium]